MICTLIFSLRHYAILAVLIAFGASVAAPTVSNVRASQRVDTHLVDIYYNLVSSDAPSTISLEISADGGTNYNIPASSLSGAIGKNIVTGIDYHIVWNAGLDRPGVISPTMRFKVIANDGIPTDQELDPATLEFVTRAITNGDSVSPIGRRNLDFFVREAKRLGFWSTLVFVPCREGFGAMNTLGGSPRRTNTKFIRQGTTSLTSDGVEFVPGTNYANRVQTPFSWDIAHEPVFVGVLGHTNTGNHINPGHSFLRWNTGSTSNLLGTYNCGGGNFVVLMGFSTPGSGGGEFLLCNTQVTSIKRPNFAGIQFDGTTTLKGTINQLSATLTHATATTGRPGSGPVYFFQPADVNQTHVVQGCVLLYGETSNLPMKEFWAMTASTYLSDRSNEFTYLCLGGQSNAYSEILTQLSIRQWQTPTAPLFQYTNYRYGGQYISYWVGADPNAPQRTTAYESAKTTWLETKPAVDDDFWNPVYFWVQGESDTETDQASREYAQQLQNLTTFLRQDLRSDLIMAVAQIDYSIQYRTTPGIGDLTLTGCTADATAANGTYAITPLSGISNSATDYSWTFGAFQITKDGGQTADRWRIHSSGTTYYLANQKEPHPVLIASWSALNGATGSPTFGVSRTGNIERVRKAQRDFVNNNTKSFSIDTRGCERGTDVGGADAVHMTTAGYTELADRFAAAYSAWAQ